jgi:tRNA pseudouridine32 synthase / 23S rRNA pseudouridine746 synthase
LTQLIFRETVSTGENLSACDFLASRTGLSKSRVKDAMNKGAVRLRRNRGGFRRLRKAKAELKTGDRIEFYYDEKVLSLKPPEAVCLDDRIHYSIWYKPRGLLAQGTAFGDHCSLARQGELFFPSRRVFLIHRLDREADGLMLLAHSSVAAQRLSELFRKGSIVKKYRATVLGSMKQGGCKGTIDMPLDGKEALTKLDVESFDPESDTSVVSLSIKTGRLHQIRRHLEMIGHPVMGDPRYGKGNKNPEGLRLSAVSLHFFCPFQQKEVEFNMPSRSEVENVGRSLNSDGDTVPRNI